MTEVPPEQFQAFVASVFNETDSIAKRYFNNHGDVDAKQDASPVNVADRVIEQLIREHIERAYPEHSIMGEEQADKQTASPHCWVIDPIDGTKAFIAGVPTFTTMIGLMHDDVPIYGAISQPIERRRWLSCEKYQPAAPIGDLAEAGLAELVCATTSDGYFSDKQLKALEHMEQQGAVIHHGGDAYAYMMLAEGKFDIVFDVGFQPYDVIPMLPILQEAGMWVGFFEDAKPSMRITNNVVVARSPDAGRAVLGLLLGR